MGVGYLLTDRQEVMLAIGKNLLPLPFALLFEDGGLLLEGGSSLPSL